jgi:ABC-type transport system involved in cytochrome c biogenesis ATPase subunit
MNTPTPLLEAQDLCFKHAQNELFSQLSFQLPKGVTLVRGGENKGKTTLLRLMAGDLATNAGGLSINGMRLKDQPIATNNWCFGLILEQPLTIKSHPMRSSHR